MTPKLLFQFIFGIFSFERSNMRWFNLKRVLFCLFICPFFIVFFIINNVFLALDFILFPRFLWQKIVQPVFIIAAPRSGTTFLFHSLANNRHNFTAVKLWEIVFAPSILQKYLITGLFKMDSFFGGPLKKMILGLENIMIGKLKTIHLIGLNMPEEDEGLLVWNLTTLYFNFFYADSNFFEEFLHFDDSMPENRKQRIMNRYYRLIQRHNFVFNRSNSRRFVSKNPLMMNKVGALSRIFPDAKILNINRNPKETIPSTIHLGHSLYGIFTSIPQNERVKSETKNLLISWYKMAEQNLNAHYPNSHLKINFYDLVNKNSDEWQRIAVFLEFPKDVIQMDERKENVGHKSQSTYQKLSEDETALILEELPFLQPFCAARKYNS
jgi:hypothetical protein